MESNVVKRAIKAHRSRIKSSGQARLIYVRQTATSPPRGRELTGTFFVYMSEVFVCTTNRSVFYTEWRKC